MSLPRKHIAEGQDVTELPATLNSEPRRALTVREIWAQSVPPLCHGGCGNRLVEYGHPPVFRVASTTQGPVVELADGKDALGETRWVKALLVPDRRGLNEPVYEGWKEISAALGCSVRTAIRYAREAFNPLPVLYGVNEKPFIVRALVRAWLTSRTSSQAPVMKGKRKA